MSPAPPKIAVVIPCFKVKDHILDVVGTVPPFVGMIIAVDDACPHRSGKYLEERCRDPRLIVLYHPQNRGVGGATISGYNHAIISGYDIVVKVDGDGQMDSRYLPRLLQPILAGRADFTKGNRFYDLVALRQMPFVRRFGNLGLTFLTKVASGFWHLSDPSNGYTAIHTSALRVMNLERLAERYFFETSVIIQLNIVKAVAMDVPIPARYGNEESSLSIKRTLLGFPPRLIAGLFQRLFWRYFVYDINAVSFLLSVGSFLTLFGVGYGGYHWYVARVTGSVTFPGTIALALLPTILGVQMLLQSILLDIMDKPAAPIHLLINDQFPNYKAP